jgi:hypothetical protein
MMLLCPQDLLLGTGIHGALGGFSAIANLYEPATIVESTSIKPEINHGLGVASGSTDLLSASIPTVTADPTCCAILGGLEHASSSQLDREQERDSGRWREPGARVSLLAM